MSDQEDDPVFDKGVWKGKPMSMIPLNVLLWIIKITKNPPDSWIKHVEKRQQEESGTRPDAGE